MVVKWLLVKSVVLYEGEHSYSGLHSQVSLWCSPPGCCVAHAGKMPAPQRGLSQWQPAIGMGSLPPVLRDCSGTLRPHRHRGRRRRTVIPLVALHHHFRVIGTGQHEVAIQDRVCWHSHRDRLCGRYPRSQGRHGVHAGQGFVPAALHCIEREEIACLGGFGRRRALVQRGAGEREFAPPHGGCWWVAECPHYQVRPTGDTLIAALVTSLTARTRIAGRLTGIRGLVTGFCAIAEETIVRAGIAGVVTRVSRLVTRFRAIAELPVIAVSRAATAGSIGVLVTNCAEQSVIATKFIGTDVRLGVPELPGVIVSCGSDGIGGINRRAGRQQVGVEDVRIWIDHTGIARLHPTQVRPTRTFVVFHMADN